MNFESKKVNFVNETMLGKFDEGETKVAKFSKKFKTLTYWTDRNSATSVDCDNIKKAKAIIKNSNVDQKIESIDK